MYTHDMHPALHVPEILLIIFEHLTDATGRPHLPTLAAIARTCRSFERHVEEILWHELPSVSALYQTLPAHVHDPDFRAWSMTHRAFSGSDWTRFRERARRVRVLVERGGQTDQDGRGRCAAVLRAMAALRDPILLTPNLRALEWQTSQPATAGGVINAFIGPSLESLAMDAKLLVAHVLRQPLGETCPKLRHLEISGNARWAAGTLSRVLRGLHRLETVACASLDDDAFVYLARLARLSCLSVDMRWSVLHLEALRERLGADSFPSLETLRWKDYDLDALADMFVLPASASPRSVQLEIESYCTAGALRAFLHGFAARFPGTRALSLVHDVEVGRRFGLRAGEPGREHRLDGRALAPLLGLRGLRGLTLRDLGVFWADDGLVRAIAGAWPELEQLRLGTDAGVRGCVTFEGLLALLEGCPRLRGLGVCVNVGDVLGHRETGVRQGCVTNVRLEGRVLGSRRGEVDGVLRRVMPGLRTVEECVDGVRWRVREVGGDEDGTMGTSMPARGGGTARRRMGSLRARGT